VTEFSDATSAGPTEQDDNRSVGVIVGDIAKDMSTLIRQEMDLAKTELKTEVTKAGRGAGMFGGAGAAGYLMLFFLSFALMYLLANVMPLWVAGVVTAVVWAVVATVLALRGRKEMKQSSPQLPMTQRSLKEDVQWAKAQKS
jgi:Flp pilus assembly protein TadB